jgi:hypothetical protein
LRADIPAAGDLDLEMVELRLGECHSEHKQRKNCSAADPGSHDTSSGVVTRDCQPTSKQQELNERRTVAVATG